MNRSVDKQENVDQPQIWHYGLVARSWKGETEGGAAARFYRKIIERSGEPALDLGCGSGRLLVPFLQAGLDVDGSDISADMLTVCQGYLDAAGVETGLYHQAMHELDLPRRYWTIFACGVVGLGGQKRLTQRAMRRCYEHLRPGGTFAFDYQVPWNDPGYWSGWLPENRRSLPLDWFPPTSKTLPDGEELENAVQIFSQDPLEGVAVRKIRHRLRRDGQVIAEDIQTMALESYTKHELLLMLELAGFGEVTIFGDFSDEPATMDHTDLVFVARK